MAEGRCKTLLWKLSSATIGLVVMLSAAILLGQYFTSNAKQKVEMAVNNPEANAATIAMNKEFKIIVEAGMQDLDDAKITLNGLQEDHIKDLIFIKSDMIEDISSAIEHIELQTSIPKDIKANIVAELGRQLNANEKILNELEYRVLSFSYNISTPKHKITDSSKCSQTEIVKKPIEENVELNTRTNQKNATEAFYWI